MAPSAVAGKHPEARSLAAKALERPAKDEEEEVALAPVRPVARLGKLREEGVTVWLFVCWYGTLSER